jgi:hypothetical protein
MAGASDISTILSQAGRIEKINQNSFVQSEVTRQILTEEEARERLRRSREVSESKKADEISIREKAKDEHRREGGKEDKAQAQSSSEAEDSPIGEKHLIDVVV